MILEKLLKKAKTSLVVGTTIASMAVAGTAMSQVRSVDGRVGTTEVPSSEKAQLSDVRAPRRPSGRAFPADPHATLIAIPEYVKDGYKTNIEMMNGTIEPLDINIFGREGRVGFVTRRVDVDINSRGTYKNLTDNIFGSHDSWVDKLDLRVFQEDYNIEDLFGKFTSTLRIIGPSESTESAFSFNSVQRPLHTLSLPYRPQDASLTEVVVSNETDKGIDVYLRAPSGQKFLLKSYLGLHRQMTFNFPGFNHITHGDIVAYRAGTNIPIDGLVGTMKFRYDDDYRRAEGYALRGASVDGTSSFSSEFYMPLHIIEDMTELERSTPGWEKFMYQNKTDSDQLLVVRHFDPDGDQMMIGDVDAVALSVPARGRVAKMPQTLGVARQLGGTLQMSVRDVSGLEDPLAVGDMVYLAGDMPDGIMSSSVLAGGLVPNSNDMSKYLRFGLSTFHDTRQVFAIHNPHDSDTVLDFAAFSPLGTGIMHNLPDNITIPAHGTVVYNSQDAIGLGFKGSSLLGADNGLVGVVLDYSITPVKDQLSTSGVIIEAVNEPKAKYDLEYIQLNGVQNPDEFIAVLDNLSTFIVEYKTITATQGIIKAEFFIDGEEVSETVQDNPMFRNSIALDYTFTELGTKTLDIVLYANDDNGIRNFKRSIDINVLGSGITAQLQYFDVNHNPTDTLKVNEPFYVEYNVERFDGGDIGELLLIMSPDDGATPDDVRVTGLSGSSVSGEVYVESGIGVGQSDGNGVSTLEITPEVNVFNTGGSIFESSVDGNYGLPPERVYDDISDYRNLTDQNIDELATILSRIGVIAGGTTQINFDQAKAGLQNIVADPTFSGVEINDFQNRIYFPTSSAQNWFDLGSQTYFAEQNTDDLKLVYQVN